MIHLGLDQSLDQLSRVLSPLAYGKHPTQLNDVDLPKLPAAEDLIKGNIEIDSKDIKADSRGRAIVHDHLVLIYIKDQGSNYPDVMGSNLEKGKMIHLRRCGAVKKREANGGGDRYNSIIRDDGFFPVYRQGYMSVEKAKLARRRVCLICLKELGIHYKNYNGEYGIQTFDFEAYLKGELASDKLFGAVYEQPNYEQYPDEKHPVQEEPFRTIILEKNTSQAPVGVPGIVVEKQAQHTAEPENSAGVYIDTQTKLDVWSEISTTLRESSHWRCSECSVYLGDNQGLLHVHHKNGNKGDNRKGNLAVLCKECHSNQPNHAHLKPSPQDQKVIDDSRLVTSFWPLGDDDLIRFLQDRIPSIDINNVEYEIDGEVVIDAVAIDYAAKIAICYNHEFYLKDRLNDWKIIEIDRLISLNDLQQKIDLYVD